MMTPETRRALQEALAMGRGEDGTVHVELLARLQTQTFLDSLDTAADYQMASKFRLHVAQVLEAVAKNPASTARHIIVELTASEVFLADEDRLLSLIRAGAHVRPPPPPLIDFWDRHSQPDDEFTPTTIPVLVENGHADALALLERKLVDPSRDDGEKLAWMRTCMLAHRNDVPLLNMCHRLLATTLPGPLRPSLVEALFDYRPAEWYRPTVKRSAPRLEAASDEALLQIEELGHLALGTIALSAPQREVVQARLEEAARLREGRPR